MTAKAIGLLVGLVLAFALGWYFGRLAIELKDSKTIVKQEVAAQAKQTNDQKTVAQEAKTYEAATDPLAPLPAPVVRLCYTPAPAPVPSAHPAGSGAHEAAPVPAPAPEPSVPGPDIGRPGLLIGKSADAQVAGLQDYIERVCQAKAP